MSSVSLGSVAKCGTLKCNTLEAKNSGGDPHLVKGDLEITGDATVDGQLTAKQGNVRIEHKGGSSESTLDFRTPTQTWDIHVDESTETMSVGLIKDGSASGVSVLSLFDIGGNIGCRLPATPMNLESSTGGAQVDAGVASTHSFVIEINGTQYKLLLATP